MEAVRTVFALIALVGMIGLVKPIARLKMADRWHAFAWFAVGMVGFAAVNPTVPDSVVQSANDLPGQISESERLEAANRELERTLEVCGSDGCDAKERARLDGN